MLRLALMLGQVVLASVVRPASGQGVDSHMQLLAGVTNQRAINAVRPSRSMS